MSANKQPNNTRKDSPPRRIFHIIPVITTQHHAVTSSLGMNKIRNINITTKNVVVTAEEAER